MLTFNLIISLLTIMYALSLKALGNTTTNMEKPIKSGKETLRLQPAWGVKVGVRNIGQKKINIIIH